MTDNDDRSIDKLLLRPDEVATLLDVPCARSIGGGRTMTGLAVTRIGRHVRYRVDIERWLEDHPDPQ